MLKFLKQNQTFNKIIGAGICITLGYGLNKAVEWKYRESHKLFSSLEVQKNHKTINAYNIEEADYTEFRARDLGIPFEGEMGVFNAITDVPGVTVGYSTINQDINEKSVRTGVSAILPRGKDSFSTPVTAGWFALNGNGEMTGTTWVTDSGLLEGPIMVTNTHSVGTVHQATIEWAIKQKVPVIPSIPVVAETMDIYLNDINGLHVKKQHVFEALESAKSENIAEGNVGSGTGMICFQFKGGIGTSSRKVTILEKEYSVGVWVQANHGLRNELLIRGIEVGKMLDTDKKWKKDAGSIIVIIATDAPLLQHQLNRVARHAALGLARTGGVAHNSSGDIMLAFSTGNKWQTGEDGLFIVKSIPNEEIDPIFIGTVQATEEAIINSLVAAKSMTGKNGFFVPELPKHTVKKLFERKAKIN